MDDTIDNENAKPNPDPLDCFKAVYQDRHGFLGTRGRVTEADTRANLIDRIIHEVLGWPRDAVRREVYSAPGYLDYELNIGRPVVVIEAKAEGNHFTVPQSKKARRLKISGALSSDKAIREAVEQTQRYCSDRGIKFGVTTNGYSFIVFRAISEGSPWKDSNAYVYKSYKEIIENFTEFYNLLSYEAVKDGLLENAFRHDGKSTREYYRPIDSIIDADATYGRNPLNIALRPYVDKFFGDIAKQDAIEVLEHCYIHSRPVQTIDTQLSLDIRDQIPVFAIESEQIRTSHTDQYGPLGRAISTVTNCTNEQLQSKGGVSVLMGGIGAGKSTFLRRFFRVIEPKMVAPSGPALLVYLDLLGAIDDIEEIRKHVWKTISNELSTHHSTLTERESLLKIFSSEISQISKIYGETTEGSAKINDCLFQSSADEAKFSEQALKWSAANYKHPIVVFDNVDQLSESVQAEVFTLSQYLSKQTGCSSILVLREESYCNAQMQKQLTAYTINKYHLSSPSFRKLIQVRIDFAANEASQGEDDPALVHNRMITEFFRMLRKSVFDKNKNIVRLVEAVSFGNMRLALDLFNSFIISGATDIEKIIEKSMWHTYTVPFHEFAKSVILGDYKYYKESRSSFINIFLPSKGQNASYFTCLRILKYLATHGNFSKQADGFCSLQETVAALGDMFDNEEDVVYSVERLIQLNRQLIELDTRNTESIAGASKIRITSSGQYYLRFLVNAFAYLDLVWQDTPLPDRGLAEQLARQAPSTNMIARFIRVERYLDVLRSSEKIELGSTPGDAPEWCGPFMPSIIKQYLRERKVIAKKLKITTDVRRTWCGELSKRNTPKNI